MNTNFTIKNFRVFDENGVTIDIKPMTILTGCNSSGKSSIVKAAFLLNDFMKQVNNAIVKGEEIQLSKYKLDFTTYPNNLLGRFDKVIPEGSSSKKVILGYTIHSCLIFKDVDVQFVFVKDENDELNNAFLDSITFSTDEGVFYSSDKEKGNNINLNIIGNCLPMYAKIEYLIHSLCYLNGYSCLSEEERGASITDDDIKSQKAKIISILREIGKENIKDVVKYIRFKKEDEDYRFTKEQLSLLNWTEDNNSFFNIPVLDYLKKVKKEDFQSVIERDLIPEDDNNTYQASPSTALSASNKVICAFLESTFDTFDVFFKDFEHRFLENLVPYSNDNYPSLPKSIRPKKQDYFKKYPDCCEVDMGEENIFDDDERIRELEKRREMENQKSKEQKIKEWEDIPLTFEILYQVVMLWNEKYAPGNTAFYRGGQIYHNDTYGEYSTPGSFSHFAYGLLNDFAQKLVVEVLSSTGFENMSYVSSSRATVKKLYALEENNDFTKLLQRYFEAKRLFVERNKFDKPKYKVNDFTNRWIKQFGIGESLSFQLDEDGLGVKIFLQKNPNGNIRLLSDEGYGITQLFSVLLQIETAILSAHGMKSKEHIGLYYMDGYNDSIFNFEENTIAIEEPEIHLHPSYQSKMAEMFVEAYTKYNIHFIIETHSEYLIRKLQTLVAKNDIKAENVSIQYVYSPDIEQRPLYTPQVKSISVKSDGRLTDCFGTGFFDEADNAAMELLTLKEQEL